MQDQPSGANDAGAEMRGMLMEWYIASVRTGFFHAITCLWGKVVREENARCFRTAGDAQAAGFHRAWCCRWR